MKKLILLIAVAVNINVMMGQAEGSRNKGKPVIDPSGVPEQATGSFATENPNEEVTWIMDGKNYKAEYVDEANVAHARIYDPSGTLVWRDDEMTSFPTPISDYYTKNYPGEGYMIWSRIDNSGVTTYYAYRNSETLWFDKDGKRINAKSKPMPNKSIKMK